MSERKAFNKRSFIALCLVISFAGLPLSGYMNHTLAFVPMTSERHIWMAAHNVLGILFTVFSVWHIILNRKALAGYIGRIGNLLLSREAAYAAAIVFGLLALFITHAVHLNR